MVDCHIHMVLDGVYWKEAIARHSEKVDIPWIRAVLETYRDAGFTYLRDCGDRLGAGKRARELAGQYGIEYRTPLSPLSKRGHYGAFIGEVFENPAEFAALVDKMDENGCDFIKIMISGLMDFNRFGVLTEEGLPAAEIKELVHIAKDKGFAVAVHCNGASTVLAAVEAGVDSIEHGAYQNEESLAAMKEAGCIWVPTVSTVGNLLGKGRFDDRAVAAILDSALENCGKFAALGGILAPGSDAGAWAVPHGCKTEQALLEKALGNDTRAILEQGAKAVMERFCR
jgi:imidazolonepropionase-like amidohydrolase